MLLASLMPSSSVLNLPTDNTGPKISSCTCECLQPLTQRASARVTHNFHIGTYVRENYKKRQNGACAAEVSQELTSRVHEVAFSRSLDSSKSQLGARRFAGFNIRPDLIILYLGHLSPRTIISDLMPNTCIDQRMKVVVKRGSGRLALRKM